MVRNCGWRKNQSRKIQWRELWVLEDPRSESFRGDPIIPGIDGWLQCLQGEDDQRLDGGAIKNVRKTLGVKQDILHEEFIKPEYGRQRKHRWAFQWIQHADKLVGICWDQFRWEIRAQVLLSNLPEAWDDLAMAVSNSCGTEIIKFDDVMGVLLSKEACVSYWLRHQGVP